MAISKQIMTQPPRGGEIIFFGVLLKFFIFLLDFFHVLPHLSLTGRVPQKKSRVIGGHQRNTLIFMKFSPQRRNLLFTFEQGLSGEGPQGADELGPDHLKLFDQKGLASGDFIGLGIAILRGTAFDDIRYINLFPGELDSLDDLGEKLAGLADERLALKIFFPSRGLPYEDQLGLRVSRSKNDLGPIRVQLTAAAVPQL